MRRLLAYGIFCLAAVLCFTWGADAQQGSLPFPPGAKRPRAAAFVALAPPTNFAAQPRASAVNTANGAYLGCYDVRNLVGISWTTQKEMKPITGCKAYCDTMWYAFSVIKSWGGCICSNEFPVDSAKLANSVCDANNNANAVAVFYNDMNANTRGCRILSVPMTRNSFRWAYNEDKVTFEPGNQMTLAMDGSDGTRLNYPVAMEYGLVDVSAKVSGVSGVISAFYTRSDTMQETTDFSEIDFEFLNARPGVPGSFWLNSFKGGTSFGETMLPPSSYQKTLGTSCPVHECWYNFKIHWQPNQVSWIVNNRVVRRNYYGQQVKWCDMNNKCTTKEYRPPVKPSFPTFSIWHDVGGGGGFGGQLGPGSPYGSSFKNLRLVVCDQPLSSYNGPSWTYGGTSPPPGPAPGPSPAPAPKPSPAPVPGPSPAPKPPSPAPTPSPSPGGCKPVAAWGQCGGLGGECTSTNVCKDGAWAGYCCTGAGNKCIKRDAYYYQCAPS